MPSIKVVVNGASGRMSKEVLLAVCRDEALEPVGAISSKAAEEYLSLPDGSGLIPLGKEPEPLLQRTRPQVLVDFTSPEVSLPAVRAAAGCGVHVVIGTTGFGEEQVAEIDRACREGGVGGILAPNFAVGAAVMMHLARIAAAYFDHAEIIELHHDQKADAPSGTARATAEKMVEGRGRPFEHHQTQRQTLEGTRGGEIGGIAIHSVRLPGYNAHQEVVFGALGQTLSLRLDQISREAFMPGVLMAIKEVSQRRGLTVGLEGLLGL